MIPQHLEDQYIIDLQSTHNYKGRLLDAEGELTSKPMKLDISGESWQVLSLKDLSIMPLINDLNSLGMTTM